jgi:ribosomal protein S18 acetylase RimI-like enzyme
MEFTAYQWTDTTGTQYDIAIATEADLVEIAGLVTEISREIYRDPDLEAWLAKTHSPAAIAQKQTDLGYCLLRVRDPARRLVATTYAWAGSSDRGLDDDGHLGGLYLLPEVRRIGLGAELLRSSVTWLTAAGCTRAWGEIDVCNQPSLRLFATQGFTEYARASGESMRSITWASVQRTL